MSCQHNSHAGCIYHTDEEDENLGCDSEGNCMCEDDECPVDSCTYYEDDEDD